MLYLFLVGVIVVAVSWTAATLEPGELEKWIGEME